MSLLVSIDGQTVHHSVAAAYRKLEAAFYAAFGLGLIISSGWRSHEEQVKLFTTRYRVQWTGKGPFGDVRWWNGKRYVRYSSNGTVAVPGTSLHESYRAIDIRDTGGDPGVTRKNTRRSNWIKDNARRFGFTPNGFNFGEPWHIEFTGYLAPAPSTAGGGGVKIPSTPTAPKLKENDMHMIHWNEPNAVLKPGKAGAYHATYGPRNHFMVFGETIIIDEFYADSLNGKQPKANAHAAQCGGSSVEVPKAEYDDIRTRVIANGTKATVEVGEVTVANDPKVVELLAQLLAATKALNPPG